MLRAVVIGLGVILAGTGVVLLGCGLHAPGWQALLTGAAILAGTFFERWRYRRIEQPPGGEWQRTDERFIDPSSGEPVDVMYDARTGERRYVAAEPPATRPR